MPTNRAINLFNFMQRKYIKHKDYDKNIFSIAFYFNAEVNDIVVLLFFCAIFLFLFIYFVHKYDYVYEACAHTYVLMFMYEFKIG